MLNPKVSALSLSSTGPRSNGSIVLALALSVFGFRAMVAQTSTATALSFKAQPTAASQSTLIAPAVQVAVVNSTGATVTSATNSVTVALASGSGLTGTLTATPVNGIATFNNLSMTALGTFNLVASSTSLTSATSQAFKITAIPTTAHIAIPSDNVVNSVGVTVHLSYDPSPYQNFSAVESALQNLQIRHIRDGVSSAPPSWYNSEHNQLGQLGIDTLFTTTVGQSAALLESYPTIMAQCFAGYEGPNEYDVNGGTNWAASLRTQLQLTSDAVRGPNVSPRYPVIGPSLVDYDQAGYSTLGNISQFIDYGNLHNYPGGHHPGNAGWGDYDAQGHAYGSIPWNLDQLAIDSPNLPYYTTETGYTNQLTIGGSVPQSVSAVYMPRLVLEQWKAGFTRTFIYELVSEGGEDYGLMTSTWQPKPAYNALANLLIFLYDRGYTFTPTALNYGIAGGDSNLHQLLMQRHDGTFFLALWLEESSYNVSAATPIAVTPEQVTVQLPAGSQKLDYTWDATGAMTQSRPPNSNPFNMTITDKLQILEVVVP